MHLCNFKKTVALKDDETILIKPLSLKYIIPLHKIYASLSYESKLFFHPTYFQPKLRLSWVILETLLIVSCFYAIRKILLRFLPKLPAGARVFLSLIALNSKSEIVGFVTLQIMYQRSEGGSVGRNGIVVREDYRGKGLGSQLMRCRNNLARLYNLRKISFVVLAQNVGTIYLCQKFGFKIAKADKDFWRGKYYKIYRVELSP